MNKDFETNGRTIVIDADPAVADSTLGSGAADAAGHPRAARAAGPEQRVEPAVRSIINWPSTL